MPELLWLAYAFASYFLFAGVIIVDKIILSKWIKQPAVYITIYAFVQSLVLLGVPFFGYTYPGLLQALAALAAGGLLFYAYVLYARALQVEEASRVSLLSELTPVFTFVLAFVFVGERLAYNEVLAFALLIVGGTLASLKPLERGAAKAFRLSPALALMLAVTALFAVSGMLTKYVFLHQSFWNGFVQMRFGVFLAALTLFFSKSFRQAFTQTLRSLQRRAKLAVACVACADVLALAFWNFAVVLGPVSLVSALGALTPLLVFAYALALSLKRPDVLKEELTPSNIAPKFAALVLIASGIWVLSIG